MNLQKISFCNFSIRYLSENQRHLNSLDFEYFDYLMFVASSDMDENQFRIFDENVSYYKSKDKKDALNYIKNVINKKIYNRIQSYREQLL